MNSELTVNVKAILFPPSAKSYGCRYTPIAQFDGPIKVNNFSLESFFELIRYQVFEVGGIKCKFVSVLDITDGVDNSITLRGITDSLDDSFVEKAKSAGWFFDEAALRQYNWRGAMLLA